MASCSTPPSLTKPIHTWLCTELAVPNARTDLLSGTQSQGLSLLVRAEKATASLQAHTVVTQAKEMLFFGAGFLPNFSRPAGRSSEFWNEWSEQVVSSDLQVLTVYLREKILKLASARLLGKFSQKVRFIGSLQNS